MSISVHIVHLQEQCPENNFYKILAHLVYGFLAGYFYFIVIVYGFTFSRVCCKIRNTVIIKIKHLTEQDVGSNMMVKGSHR